MWEHQLLMTSQSIYFLSFVVLVIALSVFVFFEYVKLFIIILICFRTLQCSFGNTIILIPSSNFFFFAASCETPERDCTCTCYQR